MKRGLRKRVQIKEPHWWKENFTMSNLMILASVIFGGLAFYFSTTSTLLQHSKALEKIESTVKDGDNTRNQLRNEFLQYQQQTATGISTLNTKTEVQNVELRGIKDSLDKVNRTLEAVAIAPRARR